MEVYDINMKASYGIKLFLIFAIVVFARLGLWQADRHREKIALSSFIESQMEKPMVDSSDVQDLSFRMIDSEGTYVNHYVLVPGRYFQNLEGFSLISLFKPVFSDSYYIIDRGWIPRNFDFDIYEFLKKDNTGSGFLLGFENFENNQKSEGLLRDSSIIFKTFHPGSLKLHFEDSFPTINIEDFVILAGEENKKGTIVTDSSEAVVAWWVLPYRDLPHMGYSVTWFGLMLVSIGFFVRLFLSRNQDKK